MPRLLSDPGQIAELDLGLEFKENNVNKSILISYRAEQYEIIHTS